MHSACRRAIFKIEGTDETGLDEDVKKKLEELLTKAEKAPQLGAASEDPSAKGASKPSKPSKVKGRRGGGGGGGRGGGEGGGGG